MKTITPAFLLTLLVLMALGISESRAQTYRWCAIYGGGGDGYDATNCGFSTYQQCLDTISGIGGFCQENPRYTAPAPQPVTRAPKQSKQTN